MALWGKRAAELRAAIAPFAESPILVDGDAAELLEVVRAGNANADVKQADFDSLVAAGERARIVVLLVDGHGRRSAFTKASRMLREMDAAVASDAIRVVVVQSDRSRKFPDRLQRVLAAEILHQVMLALPTVSVRPKWRSFRQALGAATLDAAGLRILRFG
jgi:hypothetical protein